MKQGSLYILNENCAKFAQNYVALFSNALNSNVRNSRDKEAIIVLERLSFGTHHHPYYKVLSLDGVTFCRLEWKNNLFAAVVNA